MKLKKKKNKHPNNRQNQTYKNREPMLARGKGGKKMGKMGKREREIQGSSLGMNRLLEQKVQHREYSQWYCNSTADDRW